jgi:hypothetical protein
MRTDGQIDRKVRIVIYADLNVDLGQVHVWDLLNQAAQQRSFLSPSPFYPKTEAKSIFPNIAIL